MLSTHDEEERHDDEDYDKVTQGGNDAEEKMDKKEEVTELYRDVNINLEGRDSKITDIPHINLQSSSISSGLISNMLNPNPDTSIESIINLNIKSTSLVDVPVSTNVKIPPSSTTKLPHLPISLIQPRRRDDQDEDEEPSARSNQGSKRRRAGKEPESTSAPKEKTSRSSGKSKEGSKSHHTSTGKSVQSEDPKHTEEDGKNSHIRSSIQVLLKISLLKSDLAWKDDYRNSFNELMDTLEFSAFVMNQLKVDTLTPELLAVTKTKAADYGHIKWIEDLVPNTMWSEVPVIYDKHAQWGISHWGRKRQQFYRFAINRESARNVYSRHIIIAITKLQIVESHNYKHWEWITFRRNDDKLYTFKEGDYKRLRLQDIEDMLLLLVQGKLTNLTIEERLTLNVSLRMFTRSIVIQRRVKDLQLSVKSYQKKLNLTRPDM
uniref:Uncharacterized protein n=1 Tax=Tanacetum cinerariifolium TaxID=118510 RepID=A0A6L2L0Y8_TANCI|nr:hypothetical protein [Tanacetum cinerariifolium]